MYIKSWGNLVELLSEKAAPKPQIISISFMIESPRETEISEKRIN